MCIFHFNTSWLFDLQVSPTLTSHQYQNVSMSPPWFCDWKGCTSPAVQRAGDCFLCNKHLCRKHLQDEWHNCPKPEVRNTATWIAFSFLDEPTDFDNRQTGKLTVYSTVRQKSCAYKSSVKRSTRKIYVSEHRNCAVRMPTYPAQLIYLQSLC